MDDKKNVAGGVASQQGHGDMLKHELQPVRRVIVELWPKPKLMVYDSAGRLVGGRDCTNIQDAARTLIRARHSDDVNVPYDGTRAVHADLAEAEYGALHWAASRAKLKLADFLRLAIKEKMGAMFREQLAAGRSVRQDVAEVLSESKGQGPKSNLGK